MTRKSEPDTPKIHLDSGRNAHFVPPDSQPVFEQNQLAAIAEQYGFAEPERITEFDSQMRYAAGVYHKNRTYLASRPSRKDVLNAFTSLEKSVSGLKAQIQAMLDNDHASSVFHRIARDMEFEFEAKAFQLLSPNYPAVDNPVLEQLNFGWMQKQENGSVLSDARDVRDVLSALDYLLYILSKCPETIAEDKRGNPGDESLVLWVQKITHFWIKTLDRPFKVDYQGNQLTSPIGVFLEDCLSIVDKDALPRLTSAVRRVHKQYMKNIKK